MVTTSTNHSSSFTKRTSLGNYWRRAEGTSMPKEKTFRVGCFQSLSSAEWDIPGTEFTVRLCLLNELSVGPQDRLTLLPFPVTNLCKFFGADSTTSYLTHFQCGKERANKGNTYKCCKRIVDAC